MFYTTSSLHVLVNRELKAGNIGIVEKAQEIRFGMSQKCSRYIGIASSKSYFVSYVIVKSPSKPYEEDLVKIISHTYYIKFLIFEVIFHLDVEFN